MISMCSGEFAEAQTHRLQTQLNRAFVLLSGIQQPPTVHEPSSPEHAEQVARAEKIIQDIVTEIATGLGVDMVTEDEHKIDLETLGYESVTEELKRLRAHKADLEDIVAYSFDDCDEDVQEIIDTARQRLQVYKTLDALDKKDARRSVEQ
jgi:hypothetical protein